jgi:hypothetical protein
MPKVMEKVLPLPQISPEILINYIMRGGQYVPAEKEVLN